MADADGVPGGGGEDKPDDGAGLVYGVEGFDADVGGDKFAEEEDYAEKLGDEEASLGIGVVEVLVEDGPHDEGDESGERSHQRRVNVH